MSALKNILGLLAVTALFLVSDLFADDHDIKED